MPPHCALLCGDAVAEHVFRAHRCTRHGKGGIDANARSVWMLGQDVPRHIGGVEDPPTAMRAPSGDAVERRSFSERLLEGGVAVDRGTAER
jgi:hypothetical protein